MEVIIPKRELDFDFGSAINSPYPSAPLTPRGFGDYYYTSAPCSPSRLSEFYQEFDGFTSFDDFAFDVSEEVNETSVSADDLFDGGMIKPMRNPLPIPQSSSSLKHIFNLSKDERTTHISQNLRLSSRNRDYPFGTGEREIRGSKVISERDSRGRERNPSLSSSSRRAARSVSPLRVSKYPWEEEKQKHISSKEDESLSSAFISSSSGKGQRKWRLKDFFLFRSASEGTSSDKDGLKKYISLFRGSDIPAATNGSTSRRRTNAQMSAHELHYTANRAAKEELKKKTFLPYKPGFFGRIQFSPAIAMANGFPVYK